MTEYEYTIIHTNTVTNFTERNILEKLNDLGKLGWELVQVETSHPVTVNLLFFSTAKMHTDKTYYLKRIKV